MYKCTIYIDQSVAAFELIPMVDSGAYYQVGGQKMMIYISISLACIVVYLFLNKVKFDLNMF